MYTVQASVCDGTALRTALEGVRIEHLGTVYARMLEVKTGFTPDGGQRNRVMTFVVTDAAGGVWTYTRRGGGVIDDATGAPVTVPVVKVTECGLCGGDVVDGGRAKTTTGSDVRLCRDCRELDAAA